MPELPDKLEFKTESGEKILTKIPATNATHLSGLSTKARYQDNAGDTWFVKLPKHRKKQDIFRLQLWNSHPKLVDLNTSHFDHGKFKRHIEEIRDNASFLEVLAPHIAKAIFGESLAVPDNYFHMIEQSHRPTPLVLSRNLPHFSEFLSSKAVVTGKTTPTQWEKLPKREDLQLSLNEASIIGQLLYVALLMGHWDLFNNIDLSNSGYTQTHDTLIPAIVDWGNTLGMGLGGLTPEENAFENPDIVRAMRLLQARDGRSDADAKLITEHTAINFTDQTITSFQHCLPFDEIVYPLLPRQIIKDLFSLSRKDPTSQAMLEGFEKMAAIAQIQINDIPTLIQSVIRKTLDDFTTKKDVTRVKEVIYKQFYLPNTDDINKASQYTLINVLRGRIKSLADIIDLLHRGMSLEQIAQKRLITMLYSQFSQSPLRPIARS